MTAATINRRRLAIWKRLAREWADARWCWHDVEDDLARADAQHHAGRPDTYIDQCAEHWDLEDPTVMWGLLSEPKHQMRREAILIRIDRFMDKHANAE